MSRERYRPPSREELEAALAERVQRLADLEERGNDAVSAYDLRMGYDAEFNKRLTRNHIAYYTKQLEPYRTEPQQTDFFSQLDERTTVSPAEEERA